MPKKKNIWQKLERAERLLESPTSIYAGKTAAATLIFAVLIVRYSYLSSLVSTHVVDGGNIVGARYEAMVHQLRSDWRLNYRGRSTHSYTRYVPYLWWSTHF